MTTIVAQKIWTANAGKKFGSIVDPSGAKFMLPVGMQDAFQEGQTYEVPTEPRKWGDAAVTVITGRPGAAGAGVVAQAAAPRPAPVVPPSGGGNGRDVQIASIALMKSFIETGKFGLTDLELLEKACVPSARRIVEATK